MVNRVHNKAFFVRRVGTPNTVIILRATGDPWNYYRRITKASPATLLERTRLTMEG
jgi:hypothetical protein